MRVDANGAAEVALAGVCLQCVAADGDRVLVGSRGQGAMLSLDGGGTWERVELPEHDVFSVAISTADGAVYAGTEPSRLFVDRGGGWRELSAIARHSSRDRWSFSPRPWTHHVRWIAPDPHDARRLLVGIELGGLLLSDDGGETFSEHRPGAKLDSHSIIWHPSTAGVAYQAAGDGAACTHDGGVTWTAADAGRELGYCWAVAADPGDPQRWYVSAASGPRAAHSGESARGRLYRWEGGWRELRLPGDSMPYALLAGDGELLAGMSDGRILRSADGGSRWETLGPPVGSVVAMALGG